MGIALFLRADREANRSIARPRFWQRGGISIKLPCLKACPRLGAGAAFVTPAQMRYFRRHNSARKKAHYD